MKESEQDGLEGATLSPRFHNREAIYLFVTFTAEFVFTYWNSTFFTVWFTKIFYMFQSCGEYY